MSVNSTIDFNGAETQNTALPIIPHGTLAKIRLSIRPGGTGPGGWLTQSRTSEAQYIDTEAVILEGPHAKRHIFTRIGLKGRTVNERGEDVYANRGRALIRGMLESARGIRTDDESERAQTARRIGGFGDLNGVEFLAKIGVERDRANPDDEGRNVIIAAIGPEHADYVRLMGPIPSSAAGASVAVAPPLASSQASAAVSPVPANVPSWAR
jgi:hypothetical protein